ESIPVYSLLPPSMKEAVLSGLNPLIPGIQLQNFVDILPVTYAQQNYITQGIAMPRIAFNYLYVDIGPQLDVDLLTDSCRKLVNHFPVLRTRFAHFKGKWWQVVLNDIELPFTTFEVNGPLPEESDAICMRDTEQTDPLGLPTSFVLVRNSSKENRLIIRLSHAQYDGVCIPVILKTLVSLYQQEPLHPATGFSTYLAHARNQQTDSAHYWRELLQGSQLTRAITILQPETPGEAVPRGILAERSIYAPTLPDYLTMASLVSSAWAVVLSRITGKEDVVYGHVVAGRNSDIPGITEIVGPCVNIVPVRAVTPPTKISEELILSIQEQYITLGQSDSMGWDDIIQQCTDWTPGLALDSVVLHQSIDVEPEIHIAGATAKSQWFKNPSQVSHHIGILSQPQGDKLRIVIAGNTHILRAEMADPLLDMLVETVIALSTDLQAPLTSCKPSLA
ncbi:CoA-dependent acyltransferase, partial [Lindgomyces ingoldianus]